MIHIRFNHPFPRSTKTLNIYHDPFSGAATDTAGAVTLFAPARYSISSGCFCFFSGLVAKLVFTPSPPGLCPNSQRGAEVRRKNLMPLGALRVLQIPAWEKTLHLPREHTRCSITDARMDRSPIGATPATPWIIARAIATIASTGSEASCHLPAV